MLLNHKEKEYMRVLYPGHALEKEVICSPCASRTFAWPAPREADGAWLKKEGARGHQEVGWSHSLPLH